MLPRSRLRGVVRAFERKSLRLIGVIGLLALGLGVALGPTSTLGAISVSIATSLIASVVVAAFALEREAFAQKMMDLGVHQLFRDRKKEFDDDFWTNLASGAQTHFRVLGTANHGYWHDEQTRQDTTKTLTDAIVKRNVDVEFLFLNPDGEFCKRRGTEEQRDTVRDALASIDRFWTLKESLPAKHRGRLVLREYDVTPSCGITWVDDTVLVTHYLAGRNNLGSPGLLLRSGRATMDTLFRPVGAEPGAPLTDVYIRNYKEIASDAKSSVITAARIAEIRRRLDESAGQQAVSEADLRKLADDDNV
jgi:hypothetical protein